jgi:hypothetical protein
MDASVGAEEDSAGDATGESEPSLEQADAHSARLDQSTHVFSEGRIESSLAISAT